MSVSPVTTAPPADLLQRLLDPMMEGAVKLKQPLREVAERLFVHAVSNPALSRTVGRLADIPAPPKVLAKAIAAYSQAYGVDFSEVADPVDSFTTFNAFFTRRLRDGARPIVEDSRTVVSPADARLQSFGRIPTHGMLDQIKGRRYRLGGLLGDEGEGGAWREGAYATLYLSPRDYHRVHCPIDGVLTSWRHIPGKLFPVNGLATRHVSSLFNQNERVVMFLESETHGPMALVMVGAANVGRITLSFTDQEPNWSASGPTTVRPANPIPVKRGDELGVFNLGSTVVLVASEPTLSDAGLLRGEHLKMGAPLWTLPAPEPKEAAPKKAAAKKAAAKKAAPKKAAAKKAAP
ncbi:MAG: archaetidylserine decarboxylase, partial [Myxococcota bacterium]|nr:archaetidylserine decarboxylase [Myxococcota bacterium]